jgi:hypothetical protein
MSQYLVASGTAIFLVLGTLHGLLALRDLTHPRAFTPTDDRVRRAMQAGQLALNPRANIWRAWLGFNLSHSLGLVVFGGSFLVLACRDFSSSPPVLCFKDSLCWWQPPTWSSLFVSGLGAPRSAAAWLFSASFWLRRSQGWRRPDEALEPIGPPRGPTGPGSL